MAAEEDKKFDAVLGGFLVNDVRARSGHLHCPESDVLAAYHERSLLPEEMNSWKKHVVGCARCQAILSELENTDSIALGLAEKEEGVLADAAAHVEEKLMAPMPVPVSLPEKSRPPRRLRWQWLAPAGALAAGLLVWVAWHENRPPQSKTPTEVKTAKLEPPATPPPSVTREDGQAISRDEIARASKDQAAVGGAVPAKPVLEAKSLKQFEKSDSRGRVTLSESPSDKDVGARADAALNSLPTPNRAPSGRAQGAGARIAGMGQATEEQTMTANAQLQNLQAQQNQPNEQKISRPHPPVQVEQTKKRKAESPPLAYRATAALPAAPPPPAPAPAAATAFNEGASLQLAGGTSPYLISAAGKKTFWRAGHAGMIEFSSDGGASWSRQISNVLVDLTAGSAPSDKVCWIVGRAGTILLTTDAGSHWAIVHSPLVEDLGGVRATDALHATIWDLGNTKIFETANGGATWKPAASQ